MIYGHAASNAQRDRALRLELARRQTDSRVVGFVQKYGCRYCGIDHRGRPIVMRKTSIPVVRR